MSVRGPSQGAPPRPPALTRSNITACERCRKKKRRCDQKLPACGLCRTAGEDCVSYDAVARRQIPRSYLLSLEERVAYLELTLQRHGIKYETLDATPRSPHASPTGTGGHSSGPSVLGPEPGESCLQGTDHGVAQAAQLTLQGILSLTKRGATKEPAYSRLLLNELLKEESKAKAVRVEMSDLDPSRDHASSEDFNIRGLLSPRATLPPKQAAQSLVEAYFQFSNPGLPLLHEPTFRQKLDHLYNKETLDIDLAHHHSDVESKIAIFFVFEVFAVALEITQKRDPTKFLTSFSEHFHTVALTALGETGLPSGVEGVQALLLIAKYSYNHPTTWDAWKTVGMALRLAMELGLHEDPSTENLDAVTLDTMRRVFWVVYSMDRSCAIALTMPLGIPDGAITAKVCAAMFPSKVDDEFITPDGIMVPKDERFWGKGLGLHLFRYRQLQSEIHSFLYQRRWPAAPPLDLNLWQVDMHARIRKWYEEIPTGNNLTETERIDIENFELSLQRALLYLYRPSPNIRDPPEPVLVKLSETAAHLVELYERLFRGNRLTLYWQAVDNLSSAGTSLLYSYVNSTAVRQKIRFHPLEMLVHRCSSVLSCMVERFPAFKGKRDAFELLASKILTDIATSPMLPSTLSEASTETQTISLGSEHGQHWHALQHFSSVQPILQDQSQDRQLQYSQGHGVQFMPGAADLTASFLDAENRSEDQSLLGLVDLQPQGHHIAAAAVLPDMEYLGTIDWEEVRETSEYLAPDWM